MRHDRLIRPSRRKQQLSIKPSHAGAAHPFSEYMVLPSDSQGRSATVSFGAPPSFQRLAAKIRDMRVLPFEISGDVFRWAVFYGLEELAKRSQDKDVIGEFSSIQSMVATAAKEAEQLAYEKKLNDTLDTVRRLAQNGHLSKAEDVARFVWLNADKIEDPYWRRHYRVKAKKLLDAVVNGEIEQRRRSADDDGSTRQRIHPVRGGKKRRQQGEDADE